MAREGDTGPGERRQSYKRRETMAVTMEREGENLRVMRITGILKKKEA